MRITAAADPRPSIEQRYPTRDAYIDAIKHAARAMVKERLLLDEDATRIVDRAASQSTRTESVP